MKMNSFITVFRFKELAELIQRTIGHEGEIVWDSSKPDGTPRKLMDVSKMRRQGWQAHVELEEGVKNTYEWYEKNIEKFKHFFIVSEYWLTFIVN